MKPMIPEFCLACNGLNLTKTQITISKDYGDCLYFIKSSVYRCLSCGYDNFDPDSIAIIREQMKIVKSQRVDD